MKYLISTLAIIFFLTTVVVSQAQDKQEVKKDTKVEKVHKKDGECSTEKTTEKSKQESCDTEKAKSKSDESCCSEDEANSKADDNCSKKDKSSTQTKESKN